MKIDRYTLLSAASGCVWGAIAYVLGHNAFHSMIWGGLVLSPFIGVAVGLAYRRTMRNTAIFERMMMSLVTLYAAAILFGMGVGFQDYMTHYSFRDLHGSMSDAVFACLWGVTVTGFFIGLWPLSFLNHSLLCHFDRHLHHEPGA